MTGTNNKTILVNATALASGGALTILRQFVNHIDIKDGFQYLIFIHHSLDEFKDTPQVQFINKSLPGWRRIVWDFWGIKKEIQQRSIDVKVVIGLQNTSMNVGKIPQVVYLHQGLAIHARKWSFFNKKERNSAFYKYIYPWFILVFFKKSSHFVVQTQWMSDGIQARFSIPRHQIQVIKPSLNIKDLHKAPIEVDQDPIKVFYPATPEIFKNHEFLLNVIAKLKAVGGFKPFKLVFTFKKESNLDIWNQVQELQIEDLIEFTGQIQFKDVLDFYNRSSLMVFPSEIESFGLPLVEAAWFGKQIIALDTGFAREVIGEYEGVKFLPKDEYAWVESLIPLLQGKCDLWPSYNPIFDTNWTSLFTFVKDIGNSDV